MPIDVPKQDKVYTTIYSNFKGVDMTSDPSMAYKRRSPTAVNVRPTLDGSPVKRTGWERLFSASHFIALSEEYKAEDFQIDTLRSFTLSGTDHIIIFTSIGVYIYTDKTFARICDPMDANRSFFFEGGATAGYYLFGKDEHDATAGTTGKNVIYVFGFKEDFSPDEKTLYHDDEGYFLRELEPHVPIITVNRPPNGAGGTAYENINMLTPYRTDQFLGDTTSTSYLTSSEINSSSGRTVKVERINSSGAWEVVPESQYTVMPNSINFGNAYKAQNAPKVDGEDNIRVTYSTGTVTQHTATQTATYGSSTTYTEYNKTSYKMTLKNTPYKTVNASGSWYVPNLSVKYKIGDAAWKTLGATYYSVARQAGGKGQLTIYASKKGFPSLKNKTVKGKTKHNIGKIQIKIAYPYQIITDADNNAARDAFFQCRCVAIYGTGIINQVFMSGSLASNFTSRVWYSAVSDPTFFPELNYIEAGSDDTKIMGLTKAGDYLGIVKHGFGANAAVYLAYPTSFEDNTTYAVKQAVTGIGAVSTRTFSTLNGEPLFLSQEGVYAIIPTAAEENERQIRNRSYFVNGAIKEEPNLDSAFSFVHDGIYYLCVNDHCYLLDSSQQSSWANSKTNLQYECYYWDNIPAVAMAEKDGELLFAHSDGSLCAFRNEDMDGYSDGGDVDGLVITENVGISRTTTTETFELNLSTETTARCELANYITVTPQTSATCTVWGDIPARDVFMLESAYLENTVTLTHEPIRGKEITVTVAFVKDEERTDLVYRGDPGSFAKSTAGYGDVEFFMSSKTVVVTPDSGVYVRRIDVTYYWHIPASPYKKEITIGPDATTYDIETFGWIRNLGKTLAVGLDKPDYATIDRLSITYVGQQTYTVKGIPGVAISFTFDIHGEKVEHIYPYSEDSSYTDRYRISDTNYSVMVSGGTIKYAYDGGHVREVVLESVTYTSGYEHVYLKNGTFYTLITSGSEDGASYFGGAKVSAGDVQYTIPLSSGDISSDGAITLDTDNQFIQQLIDGVGEEKAKEMYAETADFCRISEITPVAAEWSTILDNDGATQYFKNLQKKGCLVSLQTFDYADTGASVYLRVDDTEEKLVATAEFGAGTRPKDIHLRKKVKKYKRLQFIVRSEKSQPFGVNEITKVYTLGNYSKNKGG